MIGRRYIPHCLPAAALLLGAAASLDAQAASVTGTMAGRYGDPIVPGIPPRLEWVLRDDQSREWRVELPGTLVEQAGGFRALQGRRVTVSGAVTDGARPLLRASSVRGNGVAALSVSPPQFGSKRYALLLCKFGDVSGEPISPAQATTLLSNSYPNMDHYYREVSAGQMDLVGSQVFGWFTLPQPRSFYVSGGNANLSVLAQHCAAAADASVDFTQFFGVIVQVNADLDGSAWGGSTFLTIDGQSRVWPATWMPLWATQHSKYGVYAHEIGHSLGLPHSSGPYGATYDSEWDVMSDSYLTQFSTDWVAGQTIAYHRDLLSWIPANRKVTAGPGAQTWTLEYAGFPPPGTNPLMVTIPIPGSSHYYTLEARRQQGYDTPLPGEGVIIHRIRPGMSIRAVVVDPDNNGDPNDAGAIWIPGETFSDGTGVVVQVNSATANGWSVTVTLPGASHTLTVAGAGSGNGTVSSAPSGINCTSTAGTTSGNCSAGFADGSSVTLMATPTSGTFTGWSGACSGTGTCVVSMTQARSVTATFTADAMQLLTVAGGGTGSGTVASSPAGISCTSTAGASTGACAATFSDGAVVILTATSASGSTFTGWSGACSGTDSCQVTMDQARVVAAHFELPRHILTVSGAGTGSGTVTSTPAGIACAIAAGAPTGSCTADFLQGTAVTLTATAASGSFTGWSGACNGTGTCIVPMAQLTQVTASFELPRHQVTLQVSGSAGATVTSSPAGISCTLASGNTLGACSASFVEGTSLSLAFTSSGFLTGWGGACANATGACQFVVGGPRSATVAFASNQEVIGLAADALMGTGTLPAALRSALDATGNQNGSFDAGDLVALIDRTPGATLTARVVRAIAGGRP